MRGTNDICNALMGEMTRASVEMKRCAMERYIMIGMVAAHNGPPCRITKCPLYVDPRTCEVSLCEDYVRCWGAWLSKIREK